MSQYAPSPENWPFPWRIRAPSNTLLLGFLARVRLPNGISIGSAVFAGRTLVTNRVEQTDRQTDRPRYNADDRPHRSNRKATY